MIICTREDANKLIGDESNLFKNDERNKDIVASFINYEVEEIKHGRGLGVENLDDERRKEIALLALTSGLSKEEVSRLTGASISQVGAYKRGDTSSASEGNNNNLKDHVREIKTEINNAAQNKLMMAIEAITGDKLAHAKVRDIAGIARDMSSVVRNMSGDGNNIDRSTKVLIYQPRVKEEDDFDIITVNE